MKKRVLALAVLAAGVFFAFAMTLGGCDDSCVDTGCVEIDAGPDVKEAGKKDAAKDVAVDAPAEAATDASSDAAEEAGEAGDAAAD